MKHRPDEHSNVLANMKGLVARQRSRAGRKRWIATLSAALLMASVVPASAANERPWEGYDRLDQVVGQGFSLNPSDVQFILEQIKISEQHAVTMATVPNPDPVGDPYYCQALIGPGPNQIPEGANSEELSLGLRVLDGTCNNLVPGRGHFGAADQPFTRLTTPVFDDAETFDPDGPGPIPPVLTTYNGTNPLTGGTVVDSTPRIASNLIVDQTDSNPAALAAGDVLPNGSVDIPNVAPDEGLSAPYNDMFTFFGQFFDHGLDLKTENGNELVYMPLRVDDPLYDAGSSLNFMVITRTTTPGTEASNRTTPFVDQNQTYSSHPSHQVFLREYASSATGPVSTGRLIEGTVGGMATWDDVQAQAATMLGIELGDNEVGRVPLLATDVYGRFVPGPVRGMPMLITGPNPGDFIEGDPAAPVDGALGLATGHAFLLDISNFGAPGEFDADGPFGPTLPVMKTPDADTVIGDDNDPATFDDEMLGAHFMAGDGRVNENIALTAVHHVFHSEHNRIANPVDGQIIDILTNLDPASIPDWELSPGVWNGEYLFQAGKFLTEMEYQHLAFEEFARKVQPQVNEFIAYDKTINAAITGEFAHSVYRFGHSMLNDEVLRFNETGTPDNLTLVEAFLNPPAFLDGGTYTPEQAAGAIFRGGTTQVGQEIDEFVVEALRNNLLGLPLDLATINMARGREAGIPSLNEARAEFFAVTNDSILAPYQSWVEFKFELRHSESFANFIGAYGTHSFITTYDPDGAGPIVAESLDARRAAAEVMLDIGHIDRPADAGDFLNGTGTWAGLETGINDVDLWSGGLAEGIEPFGGLLGPTLNYVFELQMENLQDGDRFYYLARTAGLNILTALEGNSFAELIERNTDVTNLPADVFSRPDYFFDVGFQNGPLGDPNAITDDPATSYDELNLPTAPDSELVRTPNGTVRFVGGEHSNMVGGPGNDRIHAGIGDDTVRGGDGNDILEGDSGNDAIIGGEGDDIITDAFGDDGLKGGPGNDAISGGQGADLIQGADGSDFIVQGSDPSETFGGLDNDFIYGGASFAVLFGDYGDDWIEGGGQADLIQGDNGNPFENDVNGGHDVLNGNGGPDDYIGEGGDDVLVASPGTSQFEGMLGYDFVTFKDFTTQVDADMDFNVLVPDEIEPLRSRYDFVESLSGWTGDDILRGDSEIPLLDNFSAVLTQETIDRFPGLEAIAVAGDNGNIIMGGGGSDLIEGRGENDVIDGDRWLNVQLEANGNRYDSMLELQGDVFSGALNPGDISIVREILIDDSGSDTAYFEGLFSEYDFGLAGETLFVDHSRGCGADVLAEDCTPLPNGDNRFDTGIDRLTNIETLQFLDFTIDLSAMTCNGQLATVILGLGYVHPQFGLAPTIGNDTINGTSASDTIDGLDGADLICAGEGADTINGGDGNDVIFGEGGNDTINGDNGFDQLIGQAGIDTINGGNDADYIFGGIGNDILDGGDNGVDTLDIVEGGPDDDTITGGSGNDLVIGHEGNDTLSGGTGDDYLWGGPGLDSYAGEDGRDVLDGNDAGEDVGEIMDGGAGDDLVLGHGGNDTLIGGPAVGDGSDYLWGGIGLDTYEGGDGIDYLDGNDAGEDLGETMNGGDGADFVIGWGGDDILDGGDGDGDYVWGGEGLDTLEGGAGIDDICEDPQAGTFGASCEFQIPAPPVGP